MIKKRKVDTASVEPNAKRTSKDTKQKNKSTKTVSTVEPCLAGSSSSVPGSKPSTIIKGTKQFKSDTQSNNTREFKDNWKIGRPWLMHENNIMWCEYCRENEKNIKLLIKSRNMIEGSTIFKKETVANHETSKAHEFATQIHQNKDDPKKAPAHQITAKLNANNRQKLEILFRNVHSLVKNHKSLADYIWICELDERKGIDIGTSYRSREAAKRFAHAIASFERSRVAELLRAVPFFSITCDGSTDSQTIEQEIVFATFCKSGSVHTKFIGIDSPERADATGITNCILGCLLQLDASFDENFLRDKLVALGCDGAAVMTGVKGGVGKQLRNIQPCLVTVHCYAHR